MDEWEFWTADAGDAGAGAGGVLEQSEGVGGLEM